MGKKKKPAPAAPAAAAAAPARDFWDLDEPEEGPKPYADLQVGQQPTHNTEYKGMSSPPPLDSLPAAELLPEVQLRDDAGQDVLDAEDFRLMGHRTTSKRRPHPPSPPHPHPHPHPAERASYTSPTPPRAVDPIVSPALSALADNALDDSGFDARAWARDVPFGASPPTGGPSPKDSPSNMTPLTAALGTSPSAPPFNLASSPPSGNDRSKRPISEDFRGGFGGASPGLSPRGGHRLPIRQSAGDSHPISVSPKNRPVVMQRRESASQRPSPHHMAFGEPDMAAIPHRSSVPRVTASGPLVLFDEAYYEGHIGEVVLVATGNSLHISRLEREKLTLLGFLNGLRGTVLAAKLLPPLGVTDFEPIVITIVHGPSAEAATSSGEVRTTVEAHSIKDGRHLATLYRSPPQFVGPRESTTDPSSAVGALAVQVSGAFIIVTSGQSGEVYIFKYRGASGERDFICLGKTWTSMPPGRSRAYSISSASSVSTTSHEEKLAAQNAPETGIVSLSQRWLAIVPPPASSQTSLQGEVGVPGRSSREPPGLMSHTSPAQPSANCEAETPLDESFINKVARDAAQEAMKSARRAGEAGYQAIKNYWNKTDASPGTDFAAQNQPYGAHPSSFPPTHAQENMARPAQASTLVSIIDLERLSESSDGRPGMLVQPIATFPVRYGCSFLAFNPTGLSLFTSSSKGDVSYIWCLMRMIHGVVATPQGDVSQADSHASVRQIARFSRFTTSNIVDVIWTKPKGEKLAILTEKGTVHIHDLPVSAFRWPPPVRHSTPSSTPGATSETSSQQGARSRFGDAISFVQGTAQSFSTAKLRSSLTGATFSGLAASAGLKGGRMVAAGISKSVGAASGTMSDIRHMGENRTRLPGGQKARIVPGTVALLSGKYQDAIAITGDEAIKLHAIRLSVSDGGKGKRSIIGEEINQLSAPRIDDVGNTSFGPDGSRTAGKWLSDTAAQFSKPGQPQPQPLSFAEIETSTPYRTFHNDHRVSMNTYVDDVNVVSDISDDWVFGDDIETEPVEEEHLPSGSMNMGQHDVDHSEENDQQHEAFAFDDEEPREVGPGSRRKSRSKQTAIPSTAGGAAKGMLSNYEEDLLLMQQDDIDSVEPADRAYQGSHGRTRERRTRSQRAKLEEEEPVEEQDAPPFGFNPEFGY